MEASQFTSRTDVFEDFTSNTIDDLDIDVLIEGRVDLRRYVGRPFLTLADSLMEPVQLVVRDLSTSGAWIETPMLFDVNEHVVLDLENETFIGRVARVSFGRRTSDHSAGVGVVFDQLETTQNGVLNKLLRLQPPPLPRVAAAMEDNVIELDFSDMIPIDWVDPEDVQFVA